MGMTLRVGRWAAGSTARRRVCRGTCRRTWWSPYYKAWPWIVVGGVVIVSAAGVVLGCIGTVGFGCPELIAGDAVLDEATVGEALTIQSETDAAVVETTTVDAETLKALEEEWPVGEASNCEVCAKKIQDLIGGQVKRIAGQGAPRLRPSPANPGGDWAFHEVVVNGGKVYDAFTGPEGMPIDAYKSQFEYADEIDFGF